MTNHQIVHQVIANWRNPEYLRLHAGEMTAQEVRTVRAVLAVVGAQIAESISDGENAEPK